MRWIVVSLIVINIAVFVGFQVFAGDDSGVEAVDDRPETTLAPSILLLTEQALPKQVASVRKKPIANKSILPSKPICTLVGPFKKLLQAEYFSERLQSLGLPAEVKNLVVASDPGYWLHLPPEASRKEALRRLSELQRRGIDSYVIPSGNLANGISLGMFSDRDRAISMLKQITEQGYKPQIIDVPREQREIWVFLPEGEAAKLNAERWAELISADEYLQKRQNFCSDVAPA